MRPPSYYTSLANSNADSNRNSSSQQLRSSFSSSSSTSYATRSHLPFVPHTLLVAHCYTGVGSSTKPYGSGTSTFYSSNRLSRPGSTASNYSSSYSSRPQSTKRHQYSSSSISSTSPSSSLSSNYTPRSSYLSPSIGSTTTKTGTTNSYRRTSPAYTYQPIRLRERPLLTRLSNQVGQSYYAGSSSGQSRRPSTSRLTTSSKPPQGEAKEKDSGSEAKQKDDDTQQERDWSSDVARNISRNKYLIKFRELDRPRASIVPDQSLDVVVPVGLQDDSASANRTQQPDIRERPNVSVTVKLPGDEEKSNMRVPPAIADHQVSSSAVGGAKSDKTNELVASCDREPEQATPEGGVETKLKTKAPKEKRNIKLKIKNSKPDQSDSAAPQMGASDELPAAVGKATKKKTATSESPMKEKPKDQATVTVTKSKVKRLAVNKGNKVPKESSREKPPIDDDEGELASTKGELKPKDSLLTARKLSDRKVLCAKQTNSMANSTDLPTAEVSESAPIVARSCELEGKLVTAPKSTTTQTTTDRRIRFREYNYEDFNFLSVLGHGGWGFVILAELKNHEACFAVKCIKKITIVEDDDFESIMIERKVLTLGNIHPFICKLFCTFETEGYLFFAMEYCAGGDLMFHVQREGKFTEARSRFYAAEIICAIKFLHNQHIIYRDLKLDNILLDSRGHIRLVDFGMCQCRTYREEMLPSNFCGTPEYISPEIIKGVPYNHSVDWWSFGVLLYEMAVGKMPFRGNDENELLWNVCYEQIHYPMFLTKELSSLLQSLLEREPTKRMGMSTCKAGDIHDQAWFRGVDWRAMEELRVPPPFVPDVTSERDVQNFDSDFTQSTPELSPVDESTLKKIDQSQFQKFPYTNPNISIFG